MNKFLESVGDMASKAGFQLRKHSPEILVTAGIVGVIASTILACRATLKAKPVIDEHKKQVEALREENKEAPDLYSERSMNKDIAGTYARTGFELFKLYGPSIIIGTVSIASIIGSHKILSDRNIATAAAYTALSQTLKGYRNRVAKKVGDDAERDIWANRINEKELKKVSKKFTSEKKEDNNKIDDSNGYGPYARCFSVGNPGWDKNPELTLYHLRAVRTVLQCTLERRGHMFLNEVYDALGFPRTVQGQKVGWLYDPTNQTLHNYIDFGIYDLHDPSKKAFVDGDEPNIWLDFNVDGVILNSSVFA